jgi:hypothetical protein
MRRTGRRRKQRKRMNESGNLALLWMTRNLMPARKNMLK